MDNNIDNNENDEIDDVLENIEESEESETSDRWFEKNSLVFGLWLGVLVNVIFCGGSIKILLGGLAYVIFMKWLLKKFSE